MPVCVCACVCIIACIHTWLGTCSVLCWPSSVGSPPHPHALEPDSQQGQGPAGGPTWGLRGVWQ